MAAQRHARCLRWFRRSSYTHWGQDVQIENLMSFDPWILNLVNEDTKGTPTLSQEKKMQIEIFHSFSCSFGVKLSAAFISWGHLKLLRAKTFPSCDQVLKKRVWQLIVAHSILTPTTLNMRIINSWNINIIFRRNHKSALSFYCKMSKSFGSLSVCAECRPKDIENILTFPDPVDLPGLSRLCKKIQVS
jgi:hypothetical protein